MALPDQINAYQTELIKELAEKGPCVIVGRCADYILQGREDCFPIWRWSKQNTPVRPDYAPKGGTDSGEGKAQHNNTAVIQRIGEISLCSPEQPAKRF